MIHLDTSFLIRALVPGTREDDALRAWIRGGEPIGIAALAWSEFLCGPVSTEAVDLAAQLLDEPTGFGLAEATLAAQFFNASGRRRGSLVDCMIAATAHRAEAELATPNTGDFERLDKLGLRLAKIT